MGERQPRHHLAARGKAWAPQRDKMWRDREGLQMETSAGSRSQTAPEGRGDEVVLGFLRSFFCLSFYGGTRKERWKPH